MNTGALRSHWDAFLFEGFSPASLGLFRIIFGLGLLAFHYGQFHMLLELDPDGARFYYYAPMWHFDLLGIKFHEPRITQIVFGVLMLATVTMALGLCTRTSILVVLLGILYLKGCRDGMAGDVHHRYLMSFHLTLLLLLAKSGHVYSLDNVIRRGRRTLEAWEATWPLRVMQLYVCSFYFWSAMAKARKSGLEWIADGGRIQQTLMSRNSPGDLAFQIAQIPELCTFLGLFTYAFEFGFPLLLLVRRPLWRFVLLLPIIGFHVANYVLIGAKFLLVPLVYLIFFDLDAVAQWIRIWMPRRGMNR